MYELKNKRVFVGLSGGVDSAVSAALLTRAGAHVTGVFIKGWYPSGMPCPWSSDRRDAMRVAALLNIGFVTLDASQEYKRNVVDYLLSEYNAGRTPNPDIFCNKEIKFGFFAKFAFEHGADFIATGHYASITNTGADGVGDGGNARMRLIRGTDADKDQSYFLWAISRDVLPKIIFPIGNMQKKEVRRKATVFHLPVAQKKDSQGICFLGDVSIEELLRSKYKITSGVAIDSHGKEVGRHNGAIVYTLGERVALSGAIPGPWYVQRKDILKNILVVSSTPWRPTSANQLLSLRESNWFADPESATHAQYRYHGPIVPGRITYEQSGEYVFHSVGPLPEIPAPGQSLVAYCGQVCVGGGIIN